MLDIALTIRAETDRVAIVTTGVAPSNRDVGTYNHMLVFQYDADRGRWIYINPPGKQLALSAPDFETENLHKKTEFKVYQLLEHGPRVPKG